MKSVGLSVSDIGQRLRIRRPYIEAIEAGRFDALPGAAYIPAFLRAYAVHVGLEPEKVLTAYQLVGRGADRASRGAARRLPGRRNGAHRSVLPC